MVNRKQRFEFIKSLDQYKDEDVARASNDWEFYFRTETGTYTDIIAITEAEIAQRIDGLLFDITGDLASLLGEFPELALDLNPKLVEIMGKEEFNKLVELFSYKLDHDDPNSEYPFLVLFTQPSRYKFANKLATEVKWFRHFLNIGIGSEPTAYYIDGKQIWIYEV